MGTLRDRATSLLVDVEAERRKPASERETQANDESLERVAALLHAATRPDRTDSDAALPGLIGREVTDSWSLTSALAECLCAFDQDLPISG